MKTVIGRKIKETETVAKRPTWGGVGAGLGLGLGLGLRLGLGLGLGLVPHQPGLRPHPSGALLGLGLGLG